MPDALAVVCTSLGLIAALAFVILTAIQFTGPEHRRRCVALLLGVVSLPSVITVFARLFRTIWIFGVRTPDAASAWPRCTHEETVSMRGEHMGWSSVLAKY